MGTLKKTRNRKIETEGLKGTGALLNFSCRNPAISKNCWNDIKEWLGIMPQTRKIRLNKSDPEKFERLLF